MTYAITMVTCNSDTFLDEALRRCWSLTTKPLTVIIIDNASTDSTIDIVKSHQQEHRSLVLLRNPTNQGFAHGQNQAIQLAARTPVDAVLVLNPDVLMDSNYPTVLLQTLTNHPHSGSAMGKLLRLQQSSSPRNDIIDSTGFVIRRSFAVVDRGAGEMDRGQYESQEEVFGGSGAATLYRMEALNDIALGGMVFEESFGSYKEDVDVSWRLQWRGWQHWYHPDAVADHVRSHQGGAIRVRLQQRSQRSTTTRRLSFANHYRVIVRNVPITLFLQYAPWVIVWEVAKILYCTIREPWTLLGIVDVIFQLPQLLKARSTIFRRSTVTTATLSHWLTHTSLPV